VEQKIAELFQIDQHAGYAVTVTGVPDQTKGEALVLLTTVEISSDELREKLLGAGLTGLWVPKIIRRVEQIPVLGSGKLDLKRCRELAMSPA
jgi:acyl-[acyl-carrier-protein]-phospholipid O-acyltransferase/long-chain-fatty-acid--[acyl-carrier-protein] ligase